MPHRNSVAPAPSESAADRLQASVDELSQNVRVLTDIVDQVREDLSWLTRNGVPHQPLSVVVHRMPHIGESGTPDMSMAPWPVRDPTAETLSDEQLREAAIDQVVERLGETLGQFAQEQLNALLSVMDHAHREVMQAIRGQQGAKPDGNSPPAPQPRRRRRKADQTPAAAAAPPREPPPSGKLF
jgi:hypothetical protein